ncbi:MAG: putative dehydrogenase [Akkermansiaceae bacterium]|jgi:predicted dehydrogenase|tara:strand:- start:7802 stop:8881 length:1080 start_codon:yes stop_codon:yes gene_type:complete
MATKIGVIGAGGMLQYHHAGFVKAGGEVVAVCDMNAEAAIAAAEKYGVSQTYTDVAELLANDEIDAVSIIVPNKFHAPLAVQCLEAGKHVFCEKPPALNAAEVQGMIEAAETSGTKLMFNFNNRARPESVELKKRIEAGEIGKINSAQSKWIRRTGIPGFGGWFTTKDLAGGGATIDLLHMIDLALYFMDYPKPTNVLGQTFNTFMGDPGFKGPWGIPDRADGVTDVESAAHGFVTFDTGQVLTLQVSWAEMIKREEVSVVFQGMKAGGKIERLFGTDGLDETAIDTCELYTQKEGKSVDTILEMPECEDMGRIDSAANFVESIEGKAAPLNTPDQALHLMTIIDAIYESSNSGKAVLL